MNLIFLDLETSDLDWEAPRAQLLEIGMLAVCPRSLRELAAWSTPIQAHLHVGEWHPKVVEMHSANGLLEELRGPRAHLTFEAGGFPTLAQAQAQAVEFFFANGGASAAGKSPLCGANVQDFDRLWLKRMMPDLERCFGHRAFDSSAFWQLCDFVTGTQQQSSSTAHRALDDCRQSVQTVRNFLGG